ncbi:relaxase/mobilization nuclease domain-containing protein [Brevundimonas diminuta]|uniref:relaxase/mobilization nuclease domain-containing protein n=1 Tax=Brevundimonas diminuta TaxID=293 RepID=UPI003F7FD8A2
MRALASTWATEATLDPGGRRDRPLSRSIVLSMPRGTDAMQLHDAARAFAKEAFGERFPYIFALHDEGLHPHVHLTVRALGSDGTRLNPRKADLEVWRQRFAQALRDRGVEAEASPRRARGVLRKAERTPVRKMRERYLDGKGRSPPVPLGAYKAELALAHAPPPWITKQRERQARIRRALAAEAVALSLSDRSKDRAMGVALAEHVRRVADSHLSERNLQDISRPDRQR